MLPEPLEVSVSASHRDNKMASPIEVYVRNVKSEDRRLRPMLESR